MYKWKPGARCSAKPEVVGAICEKMTAEGRLTAENLVEDSRPESAPLHNEFTWDDSKAAGMWRKQEAMQIIDSLEVVIEEHPPVQAFVKLQTTERNYHATEIALQSQDTRAILLRNALAELRAFQRKYKAIAELSNVFKAIDEIKEDIA